MPACVAIACLAVAAPAMASPIVIAGSSANVQVGQTVTFTVSDANPADGYDVSLDTYLADFAFSYDASVLRYEHADTGVAGALLIAPQTGDPDPAGNFQAQFIGPAVSGPLFSITFTALQTTPTGGTSLSVLLPDTGAYGAGGLYAPAEGKVTVSAVPEPEVAGLALAGALVTLAALRRRQMAR
jgi:hypothetical protein